MARGLRADGPFLRDCGASQSASGQISCLGGAGLNSYNTRGRGLVPAWGDPGCGRRATWETRKFGPRRCVVCG